MREIKFRGRRIDNGQWVIGDYFKTPLTDENSGAPASAGWFFLTGETRYCIGENGVAFVIDPKTLGQFTGFKDKSGREIFEGDVVTDEMIRPCAVEFKDNAWAPFCYLDCQECGFTPSMTDVIGNIHDNPESILSRKNVKRETY